jgi:hypothetical protein
MDKKRDKLINEIIEIELDMFKKVNSTIVSPCQEYLKTFKMMRWMSHSVIPDKILASYLEDLKNGRKDGRNFMREKYAKMEGQIPHLNNSKYLEPIVEIESLWMNEVTEKYPKIFKSRKDGFRTYISCELETLSQNTLKMLYEFTMEAKKENRNLVDERYRNLFNKLGKTLE